MPYKNVEKKKEYHKEYMGEYNKTHPTTPEQKLKKLEYMRGWNARNKDRVKVLSHQSYIRNKDKRRIRAKAYREENREIAKVKHHNYYLSRKDYFTEKSKKYYLNNKDKVLHYRKQYHQTDEHKFISYKKSAKSRNYEFLLDKEDFIKLFNGNCHYCNQENCRGIDRKDNKVGYNLENSVSCCKVCNFMKKAHTYENFIKKIKEIYTNLIA